MKIKEIAGKYSKEGTFETEIKSILTICDELISVKK